MELIRQTVSPKTWEDCGGTGDITYFPTNLSLVVNQTQEVHEQIDGPTTAMGLSQIMAIRNERAKKVIDSFYQIEKAQIPFPDEPAGVYPDAGVWEELMARRRRWNASELSHRSPAEKAINEALKQPTTLEFVDTPLKDVVDYLKDYHHIEIQLDAAAMKKDVGVDPDTLVTKNLHGISLRSALKLLLDELQLKYVIHNDVLLITSPAKAESEEYMTTKVYPVGDLVLPIRMTGVPYLNRLFKNVGVGRDTSSLMMMVTPRIIIQEEEEDRIGMGGMGRVPGSAEILPWILPGCDRQVPTYQPPVFSNNRAVFYDLVSYAPAMHTDLADAVAVLEAEAPADAATARPGKIDDRARRLIQRARGAGWQTATIADPQGKTPLTVAFDGTGRYRYERTTSAGLREQVVCDGASLWHLYPELGIGARRTPSRFHRRDFARLVPWALPPVEDLARDADLVMVDQRTVAIVPEGEKERKGEREEGRKGEGGEREKGTGGPSHAPRLRRRRPAGRTAVGRDARGHDSRPRELRGGRDGGIRRL